MQLIKPEPQHIKTMMTWFHDETALNDWSGPNFRYPYDKQTFIEDLKLEQLASFVLVSAQQQLLAFGQYYLRLNRCHLGRLVVNPALRGQGIARELLQQLTALGCRELEVNECSLFVYSYNDAALNAYHKFGFKLATYPEPLPIANCLYMVKPSH